jgi:hypothetical protein
LSFDEFVSDEDTDLLEPFSDQELTQISLDEFKTALDRKGYQTISNDPKVLQHPDYPDWRIIIESAELRIESQSEQNGDSAWRLLDSYLIPEDITTAFSAVELISDPPTGVQRRKALLAVPMQIVSIVLGPVITYLGYIVFKRYPLIIDWAQVAVFLASIAGVLLFVHGIIKFIEYQRFQQTSVTTKAVIVGKGTRVIKTKQVSYDVYSLILRFDAEMKDSTTKRIDLDIPVSQELYQSHKMGSSLMVEYAVVDHRIAHIESEY